jgi:hypothetical protein
MWPIDGLNRRLGHDGYFYPDHILGDFFSLGLVDRPWDHVRTDRDGWIFGYFNESPFDPAGWRSGYDNPAYSRMTERDGAWMARIIGRFTDAHIHALVGAANLSFQPWADSLERTLRARRDRILDRYLTRLSSLADLHDEGTRVCANDRAIEAHLYPRARYRVEWLGDGRNERGELLTEVTSEGARVCIPLPETNAPGYAVFRVTSSPEGRRAERPMRLHLYAMGGGHYSLAGVER